MKWPASHCFTITTLGCSFWKAQLDFRDLDFYIRLYIYEFLIFQKLHNCRWSGITCYSSATYLPLPPPKKNSLEFQVESKECFGQSVEKVCVLVTASDNGQLRDCRCVYCIALAVVRASCSVRVASVKTVEWKRSETVQRRVWAYVCVGQRCPT